MSHPTTTTTNPSSHSHKRQSPFTSSTSSATASGGAPPLVPAMKKAKSQAVAYSLDNKNGQPHHVHFSTDIEAIGGSNTGNPTSMIDAEEEDPSNLSTDVVMDPGNINNFNGVPVTRSSGTANLSRKKATPPQPQKKLVIKLLKGFIFPSFFRFNFTVKVRIFYFIPLLVECCSLMYAV